ncbi:MAG: AAA family ATPase [Acidobacteriota bacterium]
MFNAVVILGNAESAPLIRSLIAATEEVTIMREVSAPPGDYELARIVNSLLPDLIFIDLSGGQEALACMARIHELSPRTPVIGLGCSPEARLLARHLGAAGLAAPDCSPDELRIAIRGAMESSHGGVENHIFAFLPSKAGSGCSTIVLHTALAAASFGKRVLVIDVDLRSSVLGFMLGVTPVGGTQAVLQAAESLDTFILRRNLTQWGGADFLLSTRALDAELPEWFHYFQLLNFVRGSYDLILIDLPELINPATVELVHRSKKIFPVCTTEIPSLKLTLQRLTELERLGLKEDRIGLLLNRVSRSTPKPAEIEETLGRKIAHVFPNDYLAVSRAIQNATPLQPDTELARAFAAFAASLAGVEYEPQPASLRSRLKGLLHLASA